MREFLETIVRRAGAISLEYKKTLGSLTVHHKSAKDLVTEADVAVEEYLVGQIRGEYPGHAILGEESGRHAGGETRWIIDPIDGTTSFVHDQPFYSVSVAVEHRGEMILGAVYAPVLGELFMAERGKGAMLNGQRIEVSARGELAECVLGTGFSCTRQNLEHNNLLYLGRVMPQIRDLRRYGSAAVDLSYVACGRLDGFWELNLKEVDIAAGMLIVREAGGIVTDFDGGTSNLPRWVAAANAKVHAKMLAALKQEQR